MVLYYKNFLNTKQTPRPTRPFAAPARPIGLVSSERRASFACRTAPRRAAPDDFVTTLFIPTPF